MITKVGDKLKECNLGNTKVELYREEVAKLSEAEVKGRTILKVEASLPSTEKANVDKFNEEIKEITKGYDATGIAIKVASALNVGDDYDTIKDVTTLDNTEAAVSIEHVPGTVMMIDFWATWCPPCQRPMQHNQDMLEQNGETWGDKVKIIGLSIDKDAQTVTNHITAKGWTKPIHYHRAKSNCSDVYQVRGVPHILIVDTEGKIAFKGHPAGRKDLVKDFNDLLEGKSLEGVEKPGAPPAEGGADEEGACTLADIKTTMDEMNKFRTTATEI